MEPKQKGSFVLFHDTMDTLKAMGNDALAFRVVYALSEYDRALTRKQAFGLDGVFDGACEQEAALARMAFMLVAPVIRSNYIKWARQACIGGCKGKATERARARLGIDRGGSVPDGEVEKELRADTEYADMVRYIDDLESLGYGELTPRHPQAPQGTPRGTQGAGTGTLGTPRHPVNAYENDIDIENEKDSASRTRPQPARDGTARRSQVGTGGEREPSEAWATATEEAPRADESATRETPQVVTCPACDQPAATDGITLQCSHCGYESTNLSAYGKLASL